MTSTPSFSDITWSQLPDDDQLRVVDAIGPIKFADSFRPHIRATLTGISRAGQGWLRQSNPKVIDLHVADLIDISPSQFIKSKKVSHPTKDFLTMRTTTLNAQKSKLHLLKDFPILFDTKQGVYFKGTNEFIGKLQCLAFTDADTTIIIPCLDIWRFIVGHSSSLLTLSTQPVCSQRLETIRQNSSLETQAGMTYQLPLKEQDTNLRQKIIQSSTLHLHLDHSQDFNLAELPFLAWCMVDENVFNATTRFYSSIIAASHQSGGTTFSTPAFGFPAEGDFKVKLAGHAVETNGQTYFLAQRILSFGADIPMPKAITHPLGASDDAPDPTDELSETQYRRKKPKLQTDAEVDSLQPVHPHRNVLQLDARSHRLPHLRGLRMQGRNKATATTTITVGDAAQERELSLSEEVATDGRRKTKISQNPEIAPKAPSKGQEDPFCDLEGVVQHLQAAGLTAAFWPIGNTTDLTSPFPAKSGTWATKDGKRRRALVVKVQNDTQEAVLIEWERIGKSEAGKLLLCQHKEKASQVTEIQLEALLQECGVRRGVWPTQFPELQLAPLIHRKPHAEKMSAVIIGQLKLWKWGIKLKAKAKIVNSLETVLEES